MLSRERLARLGRVFNLTNALTVVFLGYFAFALLRLYRVAVPVVPALTRPDGSRKPVLESLWLGSAAGGGLDLELRLSTSGARDASDLLLYREGGLAFGWDLAVDVDVVIELLDADDAVQDAAPSSRARPVAGLRAVCAAEATRACRAAAAAFDGSTASAGRDGGGSLVIGEWRTPAARAIGDALRGGAPVFLHASVAWHDGGGAKPSTAVASTARLVSDAPYVRPRAVRYLLTQGQEVATAAAAGVGSGLWAPRRPGATKLRYKLPSDAAPWPHWLGTADVRLIMDVAPFPRDEVPPAILPYLRTDAARTSYSPLLAVNPVRPTRERMHALNDTVAGLPLQLRLSPTAIGTWQLLQLLDSSLTTQQSMGASDKDTDDVIRLFVETPLWLLGVTFVVSVVHILFDVLALKNDILFWQSAKSLRGISVRALSISLVSNAVITAYLFREGSSLLVLLPQVANTLLLLWKIALASGIVWRRRFFVVPWPAYDAALHASAVQGASAAYDNEAVSYLSLIFTPLIAGFALYSLVYLRFTSWGDYVLDTLVSAVYTFGFVLMCPQLYINYKLKSVAAMPWRVLGYRFFNTIIDDVFSVIIKMPMMHRVSVFRDDVIFIVYMGQRWLYPIDASRPAEGFDDDDDTRSAAPVAAAAVSADTAAVPAPDDGSTSGSTAEIASRSEQLRRRKQPGATLESWL